MARIRYNEHETKEMESFKCLGRRIATSGSAEEGITDRIKSARKLHQLVRNIIWKWKTPKKGGGGF
jgi:hypothetical protein